MPNNADYQRTVRLLPLHESGLLRFLLAGISAGILFALLLVAVVMLLTSV